MRIFTTEDLIGADYVSYWNEVMSDNFLDVDITGGIPDVGAAPPRYRGKLVRHDIGDLSVTEITGHGPLSTVSISRVMRETAAAADDEFATLKLQITGSSIISQAGRDARLRPGNLVLCDSRLSYDGAADLNNATLLLHVPHRHIIHRIPYLEDVAAVVFDPRKTITRLAYDMLLSLNRQLLAGYTDNDAILTDAILDTVTAAVTSSFRDRDSNCSSAGGALLYRVKTFIELHLLSPGLSPEQVAAAHQVTVRYLNRLFAGENTSITRWINARRLEKCAEILRSTRNMERNIDEIAFQCGFSSLPYFYRRFKQQYGCTPREYRLGVSGVRGGRA